MHKNERHATERNLLISHSTKHVNDFKQLLLKHRKRTDELKSSTGFLLFNMLISNILAEPCVFGRFKQKIKS